MKKEALLFTFSLLLLFPFSSAYSQKWLWGKEGRPFNNHAEGEILMDHTVAVDNKGNIYAHGIFDSTMIFGNDTLKSTSYQGDLFLVKYDANGNQLWIRQIKQSKYLNSTPKAVAADDSDNAYVTGQLTDSLRFGPITLVSENGNQDAYIAKYYANGNLAWAKQFYESNIFANSYGYGIVVDHAGNIYTAGICDDTISYEWDTIKQASAINGYLAKLNPSGHLQWMRIGNPFGVSSYYNIASLAIDPAGNPIVAGTYKDSISIGGDTLVTKSYNGELFVAKYDPAGNVLWASSSVSKSKNTLMFPYSVSADGNGDAYVDGDFYDTVFLGPNELIETRLHQNAFVTRFSGKDGKIQWGLAPQSTLNTIWDAFSITSDTLKRGGCYMLLEGGGTGGSYNFNFGDDTFKYTSSKVTVQAIVQFDSAGRAICGGETSVGNEDDGDGIAADPSGTFVCLAGDMADTGFFGPDTLPFFNSRYVDWPFVACMQTCDTNTATGINEVKVENGELKVFPNPFSNYTTVLVSTEGEHYLQLYDITGRKLQEVEFAGKQYKLSAQGLAKGMYFIRVLDGGNTIIGTSKIVVQ